jgi:hypothetical protein
VTLDFGTDTTSYGLPSGERHHATAPAGTRIVVDVTERGTIGERTSFTIVKGDVLKRVRALP